MPKVAVITGNHAVAYGVKLSRVDVIAAYPITPQTTIVEKLDEFVESGELEAEIIHVESEHSALAACVGAASAGARTFTATSSQGLLYMHEMVWWAAAARLPIVMAIVTRAIAPPWNIWSDHNDILDQRDTGWIISMAETNQEALDLVIQAFRIAEDERVLLPIMVGLESFIMSHTAAPVEIPDQESVDMFLPPRNPNKPFILDLEKPISHGNICGPDCYMEFKYYMHEAMANARKVIYEVGREFGKIFGRTYDGLIEKYRLNDAKAAIVTTGSIASDAKEAVDSLRSKGYDVGVLRLRYIRPFPYEEIREELCSKKIVVIVDRNISLGSHGILFMEVRNALYDCPRKPEIKGFIAGLGGRDIAYFDFEKMVMKAFSEAEEYGKIILPQEWFGLKHTAKGVG